MHLFGGVTPLNVYDFELRHLIGLTAWVDARRKSMQKEARR